ncbi:MAG: WD40/YVTN/BNR-like repeat-containing protein, partial [Opitutales bacterium]
MSGFIIVALCLLPAAARAAEMSEPAPLAAHSLLLDLSAAGSALVAVGEHGDVMRSADRGLTWTQRPAPTRALLTAVCFPDATHGWVVGHDGVIMATADGGLTWTRQDRGDDLNRIYLTVLFLDARHGFAAGAYGLFVSTQDGGRTWQTSKPVEDEVHFNRLTAGPDGLLYLCGEGGLFLSSSDQGRHWTRAEVPYQGSLFGIVSLGAGSLAVSGLRGHIFTTANGGA